MVSYGPCMDFLPTFIRFFLMLNVGTYSMSYGRLYQYNIYIYKSLRVYRQQYIMVHIICRDITSNGGNLACNWNSNINTNIIYTFTLRNP